MTFEHCDGSKFAKASLTFEEAKDQVAMKRHNVKFAYLMLKYDRQVMEEAAELYARSMAAQAWEEACEAQIKLCAEDLPERWLINMVKDTPKPINPYKP